MQLTLSNKHDASWVINEKRSSRELEVSIQPPQQVRAQKKKKEEKEEEKRNLPLPKPNVEAPPPVFTMRPRTISSLTGTSLMPAQRMI